LNSRDDRSRRCTHECDHRLSRKAKTFQVDEFVGSRISLQRVLLDKSENYTFIHTRLRKLRDFQQLRPESRGINRDDRGSFHIVCGLNCGRNREERCDRKGTKSSSPFQKEIFRQDLCCGTRSKSCSAALLSISAPFTYDSANFHVHAKSHATDGCHDADGPAHDDVCDQRSGGHAHERDDPPDGDDRPGNRARNQIRAEHAANR
jgi:hypothetical protein